LFQIANGYPLVYKWYETVIQNGYVIFGYIIMLNHVHTILHKKEEGPGLNKIVANGKRFIAYGIIKKLQLLKKSSIINILQNGVNVNERRKGKKHQVFKLSFDAKWIESRESLEKLLDYVHHNPVSGRWNLVDDFALYKHSSASFYELGQSGNRLITDYRDFH